MMLGATFLHWDRFHHGSLPFRLWFWIYLITPILVPAVWLMNRRRDPGTPEARDAMFPRWVRWAMIVVGAGMLGIAAWLYLWPESAISAWPWVLTPLTARAAASFVALPGVAWIDRGRRALVGRAGDAHDRGARPGTAAHRRGARVG